MNGDSFRLASSRKRQKEKGRPNDLIKYGHLQREIGFRSATAASPLPMLSSLTPEAFCSNQLAPF
jgi:hypothetical protein